jgi:serine/threonine protein kinase
VTGPTLLNAAEGLDGERLPDGWTVTSRVPDRPGATGGNFSIAYMVKHDDGREGFCKVLNYQMAMFSADPAQALQALVEAYNFEKELLLQCGQERLSRVVLSVGDGQFQRPGYSIPTVSYIIFEIAEGDVRKVMDATPAEITLAVKLRWLHHAATGLRQLHDRGVAHQDVKPSNVLVFPMDGDGERSSKIGDLGRATDPTRPMWHDALPIAADGSYAPPEQSYRATPADFGPRRLACDLYQLGSVATFLVTGASMNALLTLELYPSHHWQSWRGTYTDVLPYVRDAFGRAIARIRDAIGQEEIGRRLAAAVQDLCDPDPMLRGHRVTRTRPGNAYALERIVAEFDLLARRARCYPSQRVS